MEEVTHSIRAETAAHYVWGDGCDGWHLVRTEQLSVIEERMPPGVNEVPHRHRVSRQLFYVLHGRLAMVMGGTPTVMAAGSGVEIAPGIAHQVRNDSGEDVRFLVISQPPSHADRQDEKDMR